MFPKVFPFLSDALLYAQLLHQAIYSFVICNDAELLLQTNLDATVAIDPFDLAVTVKDFGFDRLVMQIFFGRAMLSFGPPVIPALRNRRETA